MLSGRFLLCTLNRLQIAESQQHTCNNSIVVILPPLSRHPMLFAVGLLPCLQNNN